MASRTENSGLMLLSVGLLILALGVTAFAPALTMVGPAADAGYLTSNVAWDFTSPSGTKYGQCNTFASPKDAYDFGGIDLTSYAGGTFDGVHGYTDAEYTPEIKWLEIYVYMPGDTDWKQVYAGPPTRFLELYYDYFECYMSQPVQLPTSGAFYTAVRVWFADGKYAEGYNYFILSDGASLTPPPSLPEPASIPFEPTPFTPPSTTTTTANASPTIAAPENETATPAQETVTPSPTATYAPPPSPSYPEVGFKLPPSLITLQRWLLVLREQPLNTAMIGIGIALTFVGLLVLAKRRRTPVMVPAPAPVA